MSSCLWSAVAMAADVDAHGLLRKGVELQRDASWSASITTLERARSTGALSSAERAECSFYLAAAYLAIGSEGAARREISLVLDAQPNYEPPAYTSPKVATLLGEVARSRASAPQLEARPPKRVSAEGDDPLRLELAFEARRTKPPVYGVIRFRMRGEPEFTEAPLVDKSKAQGQGQGKNATSVTLSADVTPDKGGVLEYYADAIGGSGPLQAGSAERPLELPLPDAPTRTKRHTTTKPPSKLVWLAIPAGVVVGAAVGLGLYFGLKSR